MSYIFKYSGFEVLEALGERPILRFLVEVNREYFERALGGDFPFWLVINEYYVQLYSCDSLPPTARTRLANIGRFKGNIKVTMPKSMEPTVRIGFDISVSETLLDMVNKVRMEGKIPVFEVTCNFIAFQIGFTPNRWSHKTNEPVRKYLPDGKLDNFIFLTTEEVTELMKKLKYMDLLRVEIPIPTASTPPNEVVKKCATELKNAHRKLIEGDYREALSICRNILMNYLLPSEERKLRPELSNAVVGKVPKDASEKYNLILNGVEATLRENLKHIHKFIKEDSGELLMMPLREDAEYVFIMLSNVISYISRLISLRIS